MDFQLPDLAQGTMLELIRSRSIKARAVARLSVIYDRSHNNIGRSATARGHGVSVFFVDRWWKRWQAYHDEVKEWFMPLENEVRSTKADRDFLLAIVEDAPRSGAPASFAPGVREQVIALALTKPREHNLPFEQWSHELLAQQVVASEIAPKMSSTRVGDFLKSACDKPS
jgi:hypothetical protein